MGYPFVKATEQPKFANNHTPPAGAGVQDLINLKATSRWPLGVAVQQQIMVTATKEYRDTFPESGPPSNRDLVEWLYNRALDAENNVKILETQRDRQNQIINNLHKEMRILHHGALGI